MIASSLVHNHLPHLGDLLTQTHRSSTLATLDQVGVALFMFVTARELQARPTAPSDTRAAGVIGASVVVAPFLAGLALAAGPLAHHRPASVQPLVYEAFIGVALGATALPVMAHILADKGMSGSRVGLLALRTAVVADVMVWCLLSLVLTGTSHGSLAHTGIRLAAATAFVAVLWFLVRPALRRPLACRRGRVIDSITGAALLGGLGISAVVTHTLGLHVIVGGCVPLWADPAPAFAVRRESDLAVPLER